MASKRENLLDWVKTRTRDNTLTDTGGISIILDRLEKFEQTDPTVSQKSISRYSVTYKEELPKDIKDMLRPYTKLRLL